MKGWQLAIAIAVVVSSAMAYAHATFAPANRVDRIEKKVDLLLGHYGIKYLEEK